MADPPHPRSPPERPLDGLGAARVDPRAPRLRFFDQTAFELFNPDWAEPSPDRDAALTLFLDYGVDRLARFSFETGFDPDYYVEAHPECASLDPHRLYRQWLLDEFETPGSGPDHMRALGLAPVAYPAAFDWRRYVELHPEAGTTRWSALTHLVRHGLPDALEIPTTGEPAAPLHRLLGDGAAPFDPATAARCYHAARAAGDRSYHVAHLLGDALCRLDSWDQALACYEEDAEHPQSGLWSFVNGARSAVQIGAFDRAADLLDQGRAKVGDDPLWRLVVAETLDAEFRLAEDAARGVLAALDRDAADAIIETATAQAERRWRRLDPLGVPLPASGDGRVLILANTDLPQCTHYRVEQKATLIRALGRPCRVFDVRTQTQDFISSLPGASAVIAYRLAASSALIRAITVARATGAPIFYDLDDLIFDKTFPDEIDTYGGAITVAEHLELQLGASLVRAMLSRCDFAIGSTPAMAEAMAPLVRSGRGFVLPNGLDSNNEGWLERRPPRVRTDDGLVVFYGSGSPAHNAYVLDLAGPALLDTLSRHPTLRLVIAGHLKLDERFAHFAERIFQTPWTPDVSAFWSLLAEADINLAVLKPSIVTDAKSEIKWLEAAVLAIPSVVSDTARYREVVADGVDGLIASTPQAWSSALARLIADADLRRAIGEAARTKAASTYRLQHNAARLDAILSAPQFVRPARASAIGRPRRVLLVNTDFGPQSVGRVAKVVQDDLDHLSSGAADRFEFAVLTSDGGAAPAHALRIENYRGCPVFRLATPLDMNADWRPFDSAVGDRTADLLDIWRPDLVHVHAPQRLTASVASACVEAVVPYLVTLHDAWWISDWPRLIDAHGNPQTPCEWLPRAPPAGVSVGESLARKRALRPLLESAKARLAPSARLAALYGGCGVETKRLANGAPPPTTRPRTPPPDHRVRMLVIAKRTPQGGYDLIRAAVMGGRFANLTLTVIDDALGSGHSSSEAWGETSVSFLGRTPQVQIADVYAAHDVLLSPSTWPESDGPIAREAQAAGLWVVAADLGDMGPDIHPGVDGWVIDAFSTRFLARVLGEIDSESERYLRRPPPYTPARTSDHHARELGRVYRELLG